MFVYFLNRSCAELEICLEGIFSKAVVSFWNTVLCQLSSTICTYMVGMQSKHN